MVDKGLGDAGRVAVAQRLVAKDDGHFVGLSRAVAQNGLADEGVVDAGVGQFGVEGGAVLGAQHAKGRREDVEVVEVAGVD